MRTTIRHTGRGTTIEMKAGKGEDLRGVIEAMTGAKLTADDPKQSPTTRASEKETNHG